MPRYDLGRRQRFIALLALVNFALTPALSPANEAVRARAGEEGRRMGMSASPAPPQAAASGGGGLIAFGSNRDGSNLEIYAVAADGGTLINLTNDPAQDTEPAWSPDGQQLAFVSSRNGIAGDIYVMKADGSNVRRVSDRGSFTDNYLEGLSWSPDGTRLLYVNVFMGSIGTVCVAAVNAQPWDQGCLAKGDLVDMRDPAWSPDGTRIAFVGRRGISGQDPSLVSRYELFVANADGSGRRQLADGKNFDPAWSPDGTKIAFTGTPNFIGSPDPSGSIPEAPPDIFVVDVDGCDPPTRLTNNIAVDAGPTWSPDGTKIAFASNRDAVGSNKYEIYVMGADGSNPVKLTDNSGVISAPAWQPGAQAGNLEDSEFFVRQHYLDFLGRRPDASGLSFWVGEIEQCGSDLQCREVKRINVSAAFFLSIESQETGFLAYRTYKAAYGDAASPNVPGTVPAIRFGDFLPDSRRIGRCVQVGRGDWQQQLEANKGAYMAEFVRRPRFLVEFPPPMTPEQFVDKLDQNAGGVLSQAERDQLVLFLKTNAGPTDGRAAVLRVVAEHPALQQSEFRRAFVLMQYFGYLRRDPDDPPDADFSGWKFWLDKLNQFGGNYVEAEMVKAFLNAGEYRKRFGQ